jgi:hypothetical protein
MRIAILLAMSSSLSCGGPSPAAQPAPVAPSALPVAPPAAAPTVIHDSAPEPARAGAPACDPITCGLFPSRDVFALRAFPGGAWACPSEEGRVEVLHRVSGPAWTALDLVHASASDAEASFDAVRDCALIDEKNVYVATFAREGAEKLHVVVFFTHDAGATWSRARLGPDEMTYTDWPVPPEARLWFTGPREGELALFDPPVHHNDHRGHRQRFRTRDGGAHWTRVYDHRDPAHG